MKGKLLKMKIDIRSTTIIGVRHKKKVAMAGDGQVTFGDMAFKQKAVKVRKFETASPPSHTFTFPNLSRHFKISESF